MFFPTPRIRLLCKMKYLSMDVQGAKIRAGYPMRPIDILVKSYGARHLRTDIFTAVIRGEDESCTEVVLHVNIRTALVRGEEDGIEEMCTRRNCLLYRFMLNFSVSIERACIFSMMLPSRNTRNMSHVLNGNRKRRKR